MGGHDPYSNSKGAAELVTSAYRDSFFAGADEPVALASARAGNVIGGGDWGEDRLIPDIMSAALRQGADPDPQPERRAPVAARPQPARRATSRSPSALLGRPRRSRAAGTSGPRPTTSGPWAGSPTGSPSSGPTSCAGSSTPGPTRTRRGYLALDSTKAHERLGWAPAWDLDQALTSIVDWYLALRDGGGHARGHGRPGRAFLAQARRSREGGDPGRRPRLAPQRGDDRRARSRWSRSAASRSSGTS